MANQIQITAEEIKSLREERSCSLIEARRIIIRQRAVSLLETATTVEDLKPIIQILLEGYRTIK